MDIQRGEKLAKGSYIACYLDPMKSKEEVIETALEVAALVCLSRQQ